MALGKRKKTRSDPTPTKQNRRTKSETINHSKQKSKGKAKEFIEIPGLRSDLSSDQETDDDPTKSGSEHLEVFPDHDEMLDQDVSLGAEALGFLSGLDHKGITRSSREQKLENRKNRPKESSSTNSKAYRLLPKIPNPTSVESDEDVNGLDEDDLAFASVGDDDLDLLSDMPSSDSGCSDYSDFDDASSAFDSQASDPPTEDSALEEAYYAKRTQRVRSDRSSSAEPTESKLPIRLPNGQIQRFPKLPPPESSKAVKTKASSLTLPDQIRREDATKTKPAKSIDPSLGARFGRKPLSEMLSPTLSLNDRIHFAKLEIAELAQEAIADPEMSLTSIKRILALTCPELNQPHESFERQRISIDIPIRMMAILSLLAVYLDIIPGYRIRAITETEKQAKVSQMVARQREWEEGLVSTYRRFLELCEKEVVNNTVLSACCLNALCELLKSKTHFNFSQNIMQIVVRKLGQKEWDELSQQCVDAITSVFMNDAKGDDSLQLVRFIVRTIKSRNYSGHPQLLSVLLSLRLKNELSSNIRASTDRIYSKDQPASKQRGGKLPWKDRVAHQRANPSGAQPTLMSKKAKKVMKARAGIEKEIEEAEESVKVEEKERNQTETLKMIFSCYFRIIKLPYRSHLLPVALEGLSRFAHLINVDFFRDLLQVLRKHISGIAFVQPDGDSVENPEDQASAHQKKFSDYEHRDKLLCILTAFELLSGQGEALNLDLTDIINKFYDLLLEVSCTIEVEDELPRNREQARREIDGRKGTRTIGRDQSSHTGELIIRILDMIFFNQVDKPTPNRSIQFSQRILTICLNCAESNLTVRLMKFLVRLSSRQPIIKNMFKILSSRSKDDHLTDRDVDDTIDDAFGWELNLLKRHWDPNVQASLNQLVKS